MQLPRPRENLWGLKTILMIPEYQPSFAGEHHRLCSLVLLSFSAYRQCPSRSVGAAFMLQCSGGLDRIHRVLCEVSMPACSLLADDVGAAFMLPNNGSVTFVLFAAP